MNSVLVGMFESQGAADTARTQLLGAGFASEAISMTYGSTGSGGATASSEPATSAPDEGHEGGAISHFFSKLFGTENEPSNRDPYSHTYDEAFRRGHYGVSVSATSDSEIDRAEQILNDAGAVDIDERAEQWRGEGWTAGGTSLGSSSSPMTSGSPSTTTTPASTRVVSGATQKLQEIEEDLQVGKRSVVRGGVRIFTRVTEVPVSESVRLREEHADIQRRAVDRPATEADLAAFKEGSIEVRETAEEAVVSKRARVVGEVEVGKRVTERDEVVEDTVRKSRVEVEHLDRQSEAVTATANAGYDEASLGSMRTGSANLDPITGAPGAHPVGTGVGAVAGGVAAGAAAGTVAGPVGTAVGAAVGAVAGGLAGKKVAEKERPTAGRSELGD